MHGAGLATDDRRPRRHAAGAGARDPGRDIPFVCSYDLHANVSDAHGRDCDAFVGYRTNPHLDMRERGAECARLLRRLLAGETHPRAIRRLPIVAPTVSMLTAQGPYAEVIDLGQEAGRRRIRASLNVSVMGGFAYGDTPFNGMAVIVTATDRDAAEDWRTRWRTPPGTGATASSRSLTSLEDATRLAKDSPVPLAFADVADNPGGGGRGNTMCDPGGLPRAPACERCLIGIIHDAPLAAEAHALGVGARFTARFNRAGHAPPTTRSAGPSRRRPRCAALSDGNVTGPARHLCRRGDAPRPHRGAADRRHHRGGDPNRTQCADPVFFEHLGLDIGKARCSGGEVARHFRGGFDEFFRHEQIDRGRLPGLTSPILRASPGSTCRGRCCPSTRRRTGTCALRRRRGAWLVGWAT